LSAKQDSRDAALSGSGVTASTGSERGSNKLKPRSEPAGKSSSPRHEEDSNKNAPYHSRRLLAKMSALSGFLKLSLGEESFKMVNTVG
jgi:hypothetical protein